MFEISVGNYSSNKTGIDYSIAQSIKPLSNHHIWFIEGENGVGKTSFIEDVLIEYFKENTFPYFLIGQDFYIQSIALKSSLAVISSSDCQYNDINLVMHVARGIKAGSIAILDEFDKRCTKENLIKLLQHENFSHAFIVSHNNAWLKASVTEYFKSASVLMIEKYSSIKNCTINETRIF